VLTVQHRIAVMPGDGIGPEVVAEAERVLWAVAALDGLDLDLVHFPHSAQHFVDSGELLGDDSVQEILGCEAMLFGAAGDPRVASGVMERALIVDFTRRAGLTLGVRPIRLHAPWLSPLKNVSPLDIVIVRDIAEGELSLPGGSLRAGTPYEATASLVMHTRAGVDETLRHGMDLAAHRRGRVAVVAQANALGAHRIWHERAQQIAFEYPGIALELLYPDAAAMDLIRRPEDFDVIVSTILLGGILTDLVAALVGGMGLVASSRLNTLSGFGVFEPAHGSAPKYAGLGRVCPLATISALAMLLEHIGEGRSARRIAEAVSLALAERAITDVTTASPAGTAAATTAVMARLG
jgi:3-isopropylmalate dehydrogenase